MREALFHRTGASLPAQLCTHHFQQEMLQGIAITQQEEANDARQGFYRSVTSAGSLRRLKAASRPATRCSKRSGSPGYPAAVTMATSMLERISEIMWPTCTDQIPIIPRSLSCCKLNPKSTITRVRLDIGREPMQCSGHLKGQRKEVWGR